MKKGTAILAAILLSSTVLKLLVIFRYGNLMTLSSDDLNYIKCAVFFLKRGSFVFHQYNEPTVFITPLYPLFISGIFKLFGWETFGIQMLRVIQAFLGSLAVIPVFCTAKRLFNAKVALLSAVITAFYIPNLVTPGYILTETLFTTLFCFLVFLSIEFSQKPTTLKFTVLGILWALNTLCRPTAALYPVLLFFYIFLYFRPGLMKLLRLGLPMLISFILIMSPWWVRNYFEFGQFIPLSAASGNPMLQGTYVDYRQTAQNITYYKLGKNAYETDRIEVEVAKKRMREAFRKDFWGSLKWYTLGKSYYFWFTVFYWKEYFGITQTFVLLTHYFLLLGIPGMAALVIKGKLPQYALPVSILLYFNATHCVYMAFDRYAYPLIPLLAIFCAYFVIKAWNVITQHIFYV